MASNREERLLMRQRGANTRKIQDADFGFSFGTPFQQAQQRQQVSPRISSQKRSTSVSGRRSISTPLGERNPLQPSETNSIRANSTQRRSIRRSSGTGIASGSQDASQDVLPTDEGESSASQHVVQAVETPVPSSRKRKRYSDAPIPILEDNHVVETVQPYEAPQDTIADKENAPPAEASGEVSLIKKPPPKGPAKKRKRKSIGQQRKKRRSATAGSLEGSVAPESIQSEATPDLPDQESVNGSFMVPVISTEQEEEYIPIDPALESYVVPTILEDSHAETFNSYVDEETMENTIDEEEAEDEEDESEQVEDTTEIADDTLATDDNSSITDVKRNRRKQTSISQQRKKRGASTEPLPQPTPREELMDFEDIGARSADDDEDGDFEPDDIQTSPVVETKKKKLILPAGMRKRRAETLERVMPSVTDRAENISDSSAPAHKRRRISVESSTSDSASVDHEQSGIPIQVYRQINSHLLPTIQEEQAEEEDSMLNFSKNHNLADRPPNPVDILSQLLRETLTSHLTSEHRLSHIQRALGRFSTALDAHLLNLSLAHDARSRLTARAKQAKRHKQSLQAEWMELRRQRAQVALRCDEVRRRNLESEKAMVLARQVDEGVHSVNVAMAKKGNQRQSVADGLEFLLKDVADRVSSASGASFDTGAGTSTSGTGLLDQVKDFNGQLERTIALLEGRA